MEKYTGKPKARARCSNCNIKLGPSVKIAIHNKCTEKLLIEAIQNSRDVGNETQMKKTYEIIIQKIKNMPEYDDDNLNSQHLEAIKIHTENTIILQDRIDKKTSRNREINDILERGKADLSRHKELFKLN